MARDRVGHQGILCFCMVFVQRGIMTAYISITTELKKWQKNYVR